MIIELLEVPVTRDDGLPAQICSSCSTKVRTIEDSLECLLEMRQSAKRVMEHFLGRSETLKRMKDTSGSDVDVSPHTAISSKPSSSLVPRLSVGVARLRGCWEESLVSTACACASLPWNSKAPVIFRKRPCYITSSDHTSQAEQL